MSFLKCSTSCCNSDTYKEINKCNYIKNYLFNLFLLWILFVCCCFCFCFIWRGGEGVEQIHKKLYFSHIQDENKEVYKHYSCRRKKKKWMPCDELMGGYLDKTVLNECFNIFFFKASNMIKIFPYYSLYLLYYIQSHVTISLP